MSSVKLQEARNFEARYVPEIPDSERPMFHVTGGIGWINDPNGFCCYRGAYHLFFQYHPYNTKWGPMHWGHVKTRDFIRWERLPVALAPDQEYDQDGCFSGSALELSDGRMLLMYTGVRLIRRRNGLLEEVQTQCMAAGDGVDFEKYEGNPVITGKALPKGGSPVDFRDPKINLEPDGTFSAVVANRASDGSGAVLQYKSEDGFRWTYAGTLAKSRNMYGAMWECPDFFTLDGQPVLLVCPVEMPGMGLEFHAGHNAICMIGRWRKDKFRKDSVQSIDYGIDFYAPQTLETPDGRRIMIAWMQNWTNSPYQRRGIRLFGAMTLPRELRIINGRLYQTPVRELEAYHGSRVAYQNLIIKNETNLQGIRGRVLDMTVQVRPATEDGYHQFRIHVAMDGEHVTIIRHNLREHTIRVDRTRCGFPHDIVHMREFPVGLLPDGSLKLRLVMDRHSLELFVNDGEQAATFNLYTPESADSISFTADNAVIMDVEKYELVFDEEADD